MGALNWKLALVTVMLVGTTLLACESASTTIEPGTSGPGTANELETAVAVGTVPASPGPTATRAPTSPPSTTPTPAGPAVSIGQAHFAVEVAATGLERGRGLSGRPSLSPGTGMLFVFEGPGLHQFWMMGMQFPLDFVWIGDDCTVVDLTSDAPPPQPDQASADLPRYGPLEPAQYVLEINSGEVASAGIQTGQLVSFGGELAGKYGC